jgi:hypothetical protein
VPIPIIIMAMMFLTAWPGRATLAQVQDDTKIALSGFSVSESFGIEDRQPFSIQEPNLLRLVYRLWQTSIENLENYSAYTHDVVWDRMLTDPPGFRLQVFKVDGRVRSVARIRIPEAEEEPRFVYRCSGVTNSDQPFEVVSLYCPAAWMKVEKLDEPISLLGFFYGVIQPSSEVEPAAQVEPAVVPLFLAKQLFWFPTEVNGELGILASHTLLARHNVDIAGFDFVRREDRKALSTNDARTFYELLDAVGRMEVLSEDAVDHMELLKNPTTFGKQVSFRARVRKCSVVRPGGDLPFELSHYYQLIVFPDLRDSRGEPTLVEIGKGEEKLTYRRFPFTVCCRELPEGLTPEQIENQQVLIEGFYFRFWQFDAERTRDADVGAQISPIIIARRPILVESTISQLQQFFGVLLLAVIGVLGIVGWTIYRINKRTVRFKSELPPQIETSQFDSE